jgi:Uma2 family endonuclease
MATVQRQRPAREIEYPTGDGKPMAETDIHRDDMIDMIQTLKDHFARARKVYVSGNLLMYYREGDRRKRVAPDVFLVRGVKKHDRDHYLVWKEGRAPDFVTEITSKSTKGEDQKKKSELYREILRVSEYFKFDPKGEYLDPPLQGYRLVGGDYVRIEPVEGRLPSAVLGLCLKRDRTKLRLLDPTRFQRVPTRLDALEAAERRADEERQRAETAEATRRSLVEEIDRLRRENAVLRRG